MSKYKGAHRGPLTAESRANRARALILTGAILLMLLWTLL